MLFVTVPLLDAADIAAMLLAFIALISLANGILSWMGGIVGFEGITLELIRSK